MRLSARVSVGVSQELLKGFCGFFRAIMKASIGVVEWGSL